MKKNGFTLVEILTVVVIIAVITTISSIGIMAVKEKINENLWESTVSLIEKSAANYGEDNLNHLKNTNTTCEVEGKTKYKCLKVSVQYLIDKNYIKTNEEDEDGNKVLIDNRKSKDDDGYHVNDTHVLIYYEDNAVYAKYMNDDVTTNPGDNENEGNGGTGSDNNGNSGEIAYMCDVGIKLADCIKSQYTSQGVNNLYHHNGTLANGINDGSYRYAGGDYKIAESYKNSLSDIVRYIANPDKSPYAEDYYRFYLSYETNKYYESFKEAVNQAVVDGYLVKDEVKNYICFGTDVATCDSDHLYRIIGVFGNQVKLIKASAAGENVLGTSSQGGSKNSWGSSSNMWSESKLNLEVLNGTYLTNLTNSWSNKIASTEWKVGGNTFENIRYVVPSVAYQNEVVNPVADDNGNKTYNAKIGLMYASDYGFATNPKSWTIEVGSYYNSANTNNNWLYLGEYEWTISRVSDYENNAFEVYYIGDVGMHYVSSQYVIRPTFYLNSNITYKSGTGTETDPIKIN